MLQVSSGYKKVKNKHSLQYRHFYLQHHSNEQEMCPWDILGTCQAFLHYYFSEVIKNVFSRLLFYPIQTVSVKNVSLSNHAFLYNIAVFLQLVLIKLSWAEPSSFKLRYMYRQRVTEARLLVRLLAASIYVTVLASASLRVPVSWWTAHA